MLSKQPPAVTPLPTWTIAPFGVSERAVDDRSTPRRPGPLAYARVASQTSKAPSETTYSAAFQNLSGLLTQPPRTVHDKKRELDNLRPDLGGVFQTSESRRSFRVWTHQERADVMQVPRNRSERTRAADEVKQTLQAGVAPPPQQVRPRSASTPALRPATADLDLSSAKAEPPQATALSTMSVSRHCQYPGMSTMPPRRPGTSSTSCSARATASGSTSKREELTALRAEIASLRKERDALQADLDVTAPEEVAKRLAASPEEIATLLAGAASGLLRAAERAKKVTAADRPSASIQPKGMRPSSASIVPDLKATLRAMQAQEKASATRPSQSLDQSATPSSIPPSPVPKVSSSATSKRSAGIGHGTFGPSKIMLPGQGRPRSAGSNSGSRRRNDASVSRARGGQPIPSNDSWSLL